MTPFILVAFGLAHAWDDAPDILMLGNSYTQFNTLESLVQQSLRDTVPALDAARGVRLSAGGLWLRDHLERVEGGDPRWEDAFAETESWDVVVLQDQSLVPGLEGVAAGGGATAFASSLEAVPQLDAHVASTGAETLLFMTWGRRDGDRDYFPEVYPDFETMNARLDAGIRTYAMHPSVAGRRLSVAPVGRAFGAVYDRLEADGTVPETDGSDFHRLYAPDGSHPSALGSGLAAGVFTATLTGHYPGEDDLPGVDAADAPWVSDAIASAVVPFGDLWFPWATDWQDYLPPGDLDGAEPARVVSGLLRCTAVGVSSELGPLGSLQVGGTHGGAAGCGRLWMLDGGSVSLDTLSLGGGGAAGTLVVSGGSASVALLSQPNGSTAVRDGVLSVSGWDGTVEVSGGDLEVPAGSEGESLAVKEGGTLVLVSDLGAGPLRLSASSVLAGTVSVEDLPDAPDVVLVTAPALETDGLQGALPAGWVLQVESRDGGQALVAVAASGGDGASETGDATDSAAGDDAGSAGDSGVVLGEQDPGGCGCGGGLPLGSVSLLFAAAGVVRRRR